MNIMNIISTMTKIGYAGIFLTGYGKYGPELLQEPWLCQNIVFFRQPFSFLIPRGAQPYSATGLCPSAPG